MLRWVYLLLAGYFQEPPEVPDFGTTDFDDFEQGILVNKQSNDARYLLFMVKDYLVAAQEFLLRHQEQIILIYMSLWFFQRERSTLLKRLE